MHDGYFFGFQRKYNMCTLRKDLGVETSQYIDFLGAAVAVCRFLLTNSTFLLEISFKLY